MMDKRGNEAEDEPFRFRLALTGLDLELDL